MFCSCGSEDELIYDGDIYRCIHCHKLFNKEDGIFSDGVDLYKVDTGRLVNTGISTTFGNSIKCSNCNSLIDAKYWLNLCITREFGDDFDFEYYSLKCPICGSIEDVSPSFISLNYNFKVFDIYFFDEVFDRHSFIIENIISNTTSADFDIKSIDKYKFRILNSDVLDKNQVLTKLLQVIDVNDNIIGYILIEQSSKDDSKFKLTKVRNNSPLICKNLCRLYTDKYKISF